MSHSRRQVLIAPDAAGGTPISTFQINGDGDRQAVVIGSPDLETGLDLVADVLSAPAAGTEKGLGVRIISLLRQIRNAFAVIAQGTVPAATPWVDLSAVTPSKHTVQINAAGTITAYSYLIEGSLDGGATAIGVSGVRNMPNGGNDLLSVTDVPLDMVRIKFLSAAGTGNLTAFYLGCA